MKIEKNCCTLVHKIEKSIADVLESFGYNEVIYPLCPSDEAFVKEVVVSETEDEICPARVFSCVKSGEKMFSAIVGQATDKAKAEQVALLINTMLGLKTDKISVMLGKEMENAKEHLVNMGYEKFITSDSYAEDGFCGILTETEEVLFTGNEISVNNNNSLYSFINLEPIINLLIDDCDPASKLLPVTLVASDDISLSYSVALGLRSQGLKIEEYTGTGSMTDAEEYATLKGITILLWVSGNTVFMKNLKSGETSETTVDKLLKK
jgi:hypothetical protein